MRETEEIVRVHVHLYKRDYEELVRLWQGSYGISRAIRMIIRAYLKDRPGGRSRRAQIPTPEPLP